MRAVNLLPRQQVARTREHPNAVVLVASLGGSAVALALAGGFLLANRSADRQRQALQTAKDVLAVTPAKQQMSAETQAFRSKLLSGREQRSLALAAAIGKRVAWDRVLRHVALVLPGDISLTSVTGTVPLESTDSTAVPAPTTTAPASPIPPLPTALTIQGYTFSQDGVAQFLSRLEVVPDLKNVQLQTSEAGTLDNQNVINFTIVADIRKGGAAS